MTTTFETSKVGDKVWSLWSGWGEIRETSRSKGYPIYVRFQNGIYESFTLGGFISEDDITQSLFWDEVVIDAPVKPKTHIVNGVEVPDLRIEPKMGERYWYPTPASVLLCAQQVFRGNEFDFHRKENKLCYEDSLTGKQAAILHAKAWMGGEL